MVPGNGFDVPQALVTPLRSRRPVCDPVAKVNWDETVAVLPRVLVTVNMPVWRLKGNTLVSPPE